MGMLAGRWH